MHPVSTLLQTVAAAVGLRALWCDFINVQVTVQYCGQQQQCQLSVAVCWWLAGPASALKLFEAFAANTVISLLMSVGQQR